MLRWLAVALLAGCGSVDYANAPAGEFKGAVIVMWVGEPQGTSGGGRFVFVPSKDPLVFTRRNPDASVATIEPGMMYTDGGSIPSFAQVFKGFSPWGYAPAYMVHDWLFVARKCLNDNDATEDHQKLAAVTFEESAEIAAEAIKALIAQRKVAPNDVAPPVISSAVAGPVAQSLWDQRGACDRQKITDAHLDEIRRALPGLMDARGMRQLDRGPVARVVQVIEF